MKEKRIPTGVVLLVTAACALSVPAQAWTPRLGVFFDGRMHHTPEGPFTVFPAHLYIIHEEYYVTGIEYSLMTPTDLNHVLWTIIECVYPDNYAIHLGHPFSGHAITFWPPLTGYPDGYDRVVTYNCLSLAPCDDMHDYPIVVSPDPTSGELRGTCAPDNELFPIIGLTSFLCQRIIAVENASWGSIKSMFQ